ncbi:regulatory protein GemA [Thiomicrorhabdus indica]|uniref:gp16 family protein n=1 Tax=Thiomicrorhabdus indica TaxID=2267253 RepID=UPI002AA7BD39|nr:regulatory protein GemA [Thiomicrorhabdus indica]
MSKVRQANLAKIHIAKKDLGMSDDAYRAMLQDVAGVDSASKLDFHGQMKVLHRLEQLGFKPKQGKKYGPKAGKFKTQSDKIRALWISLHKEGIVQDSSEAALGKFIEHHTGKQRPQFLKTSEASKVIEMLKKWGERKGVEL